MWNLIKNERNDVFLVSSRLLEDMMRVVVFKNYEFMFAEEIKRTDINARFQSLNDGIEIEEESLTKSIVEALNSSDGSTSFKDDDNSFNHNLELQITFKISNIHLKWSNSCKMVDMKKMSEFFTQPLLAYTSLLMLQNRVLLNSLKEKDKIIEQYKDIKIPNVKKIKKSSQNNAQNIDYLLNSKEFQESLSSDCGNVFSEESCKLMTTIIERHDLSIYFNNQAPSNDDEDTNKKNDAKSSVDGKCNKTDTKPSKSINIGVKRKPKSIDHFDETSPSAQHSDDLESKRSSLLQKKLADDKKKKIKKLKF